MLPIRGSASGEGAFAGAEFENRRRRLRHSGRIVRRWHFADRYRGFMVAPDGGQHQRELERPSRAERLEYGERLLGIAVEPIDLGGIGRIVDDGLLAGLQVLAHRKRFLDATQCGEKLAVAVQPVSLVRVEGEGLPERILRRRHPPLHHIGIGERHEAFCILRVELRGVPGERVAARNCALDDFALLLRHAAAQGRRKQRRQRVTIGKERRGRRKIGLAHHHRLEQPGGILERLGAAWTRRHLGTQEIQIGNDIAGAAAHQHLAGAWGCHQGRSDLPGDILFEVEDVGKCAVIVLRPELRTVAGPGQTDVQMHAVRRQACRALHEIVRVERLTDGLDVAVRWFHLERG